MAIPDNDFVDSLAKIGEPYPRFRWYLTAIVCLAALNYPEEIPTVYERLLQVYIPEDAQLQETRIVREALTKVCGIMGAAKTGNGLRALAAVTPPALFDPVCYREQDTEEIAAARGKAFYDRIYGPNPTHNISKTRIASPDYHHIAIDLLYARVFSFNKILDDLQTGQAIVSCLIGIDCEEQARNHMLGMMYNGARKEELEMIREICAKCAEKCEVKFKGAPIPVPDVKDFYNLR